MFTDKTCDCGWVTMGFAHWYNFDNTHDLEVSDCSVYVLYSICDAILSYHICNVRYF